MASVDYDHVEVDGISLVGIRLAARAPERVTIEPTHAGPVWPPRRQGIPEAGWQDGQWTGVVHPEQDRALGYATPEAVGDSPVEITAAEPATLEDADPPGPRAVARALGDHKPPRDAVTPPDVTGSERDGSDPDSAPTDEAVRTGAGDEDAGEEPDVPDLHAVETRLDRAERLVAVDDADEARAAVADVGGPTAVRDLAEALEADRTALSTLAARVERLAARADRVEVPASALARLA